MTDRLDTAGIFEATAALPEQIRDAVTGAQDLSGLPDPASITSVLMLGMGGSGIAGDFLTVTAGPYMSLPVVVVKNYIPPSYVDERTLVFAVSFSGNTAETLEAAEASLAAGGRMVAVTSGGALAELASSAGAPVVTVDSSIPAPRAALGAVAVPPLIVLEDMGFFPGATQWVLNGVDQLRRRRDELAADNRAARLAEDLGQTIPVIYGGGGIGAVAASRWKTQCNENAEIPAFANGVPEAAHNEIVGWGRFRELLERHVSVVNLRHDHEHPALGRTFAAMAELMEDATANQFEVRAEGDGRVAQMLDLMYMGDLVSLELAAIAGVDPGPIEAIDVLKQRLAE